MFVSHGVESVITYVPMTKAKAGSKSGSKSTSQPTTPFVSADREACYAHFAPLVANITEDQFEHWPGDAEIIRVNATRCFEAIEPKLATLSTNMQHIEVDEIREIPSL